jgi:hypothetical protein
MLIEAFRDVTEQHVPVLLFLTTPARRGSPEDDSGHWTRKELQKHPRRGSSLVTRR